MVRCLAFQTIGPGRRGSYRLPPRKCHHRHGRWWGVPNFSKGDVSRSQYSLQGEGLDGAGGSFFAVVAKWVDQNHGYLATAAVREHALATNTTGVASFLVLGPQAVNTWRDEKKSPRNGTNHKYIPTTRLGRACYLPLQVRFFESWYGWSPFGWVELDLV